MDAVIKIRDKRYNCGSDIKFLNNTSYFEIEKFLQTHKNIYEIKLFRSPEHMKNIKRWDQSYGLEFFYSIEEYFEFMKTINVEEYKNE